MKNKIKKNFIIAFVPFVVCAVLNVIWHLGRTEIIVNTGVRAWKNGEFALSGLLVFAVIIMAAVIIKTARLAKERKKREEEREIAAENEKAKKTGSLSMRGILEAETMRKLLMRAVRDGGWTEFYETARKCTEQTAKMEKCREKLHKLLVENDATRLDNTEDALAQAEQYMLQNVRKTVNCMQACDSGDPDGYEKTKKQAHECFSDNKTRLEQVQDLIDAVTDFLNSQGQDDTAMDTLEAYRKTIMESIN